MNMDYEEWIYDQEITYTLTASVNGVEVIGVATGSTPEGTLEEARKVESGVYEELMDQYQTQLEYLVESEMDNGR